jgi:hypothetical protein
MRRVRAMPPRLCHLQSALQVWEGWDALCMPLPCTL